MIVMKSKMLGPYEMDRIRPGGHIFVDSHDDIEFIRGRELFPVDNLLWLLREPSTNPLYVDTVIYLMGKACDD